MILGEDFETALELNLLYNKKIKVRAKNPLKLNVYNRYTCNLNPIMVVVKNIGHVTTFINYL